MKHETQWFHWFDDGFGLVLGPELLVAGAVAYVVLLSDPQYIKEVGKQWQTVAGLIAAFAGSAFWIPYLIRTFGWTVPDQRSKRRVRFWAIVVPTVWAFLLWVFSQVWSQPAVGT